MAKTQVTVNFTDEEVRKILSAEAQRIHGKQFDDVEVSVAGVRKTRTGSESGPIDEVHCRVTMTTDAAPGACIPVALKGDDHAD